MGLNDSLSVAMERRRQTVVTDNDNAVGLTRVTIRIPVTGVGEAVTLVNLPVKYETEPAFWSGVVYTGTSYTPGAMPIGTVIVLGWGNDPNNTTLYNGAYLGIVTAGSSGDTFEVHCHFEARAFRSGNG